MVPNIQRLKSALDLKLNINIMQGSKQADQNNLFKNAT